MKLYSSVILVIVNLSFISGIKLNNTQWQDNRKLFINDNICRRKLFKSDDEALTMLAFLSLLLSLGFITVSSYLFAITMTEVRNALLNTEDAMLQVMDSVLVCMMPTNVMNQICASNANN